MLFQSYVLQEAHWPEEVSEVAFLWLSMLGRFSLGIFGYHLIKMVIYCIYSHSPSKRKVPRVFNVTAEPLCSIFICWSSFLWGLFASMGLSWELACECPHWCYIPTTPDGRPSLALPENNRLLIGWKMNKCHCRTCSLMSKLCLGRKFRSENTVYCNKDKYCRPRIFIYFTLWY